MSDLRTAAQQALKALERQHRDRFGYDTSTGMGRLIVSGYTQSVMGKATVEAIAALRAALEQPEQQPVAHVKVRPLQGNEWQRKVEITWVSGPFAGPLYTHPPRREWRGMTEEEISALFPSHLRGDYKDLIPYSFARAIEAALKERNA